MNMALPSYPGYLLHMKDTGRSCSMRKEQEGATQYVLMLRVPHDCCSPGSRKKGGMGTGIFFIYFSGIVSEMIMRISESHISFHLRTACCYVVTIRYRLPTSS